MKNSATIPPSKAWAGRSVESAKAQCHAAASYPFYAFRYGSVLAPLHQCRPEHRMFEQPLFKSRRRAAEAPGGDDEKDRRRHDGQKRADETERHHHPSEHEINCPLCCRSSRAFPHSLGERFIWPDAECQPVAFKGRDDLSGRAPNPEADRQVLDRRIPWHGPGPQLRLPGSVRRSARSLSVRPHH